MSREREAAAEPLRLPSPRTTGDMPLFQALAERRSCREFDDRPLSLEQVAQLCWAAQGISDERGYRTAPSAGALYPVTLLTVTADGVAVYRPEEHALERRSDGDVRRKLRAGALDQDFVSEAPLCLVVAVDVERTARKYGRRAERYCLLEAGHVAQNVLLTATALGLGAVPVGAFEDAEIADVLDLPANLRVVYLVPVGYAR